MTNFLTVQEVLKQANTKKLAKQYVHERLTDVHGKKKIKKARKLIQHYIKSLCTLKPNPNKDKMIFYVSHGLDEENLTPKPFFNLQPLDKLGSQYPNYGCDFNVFEETLGYYIANTWRTNKYLNDLLVDILYEMSWFGYDQSGLQKAKDDLDDSIKDIKDGNFDEADTVTIHNSKEFHDFLGLDITEEDHFDRYELQTRNKVLALTAALSNHSRDREVAKIKKQL